MKTNLKTLMSAVLVGGLLTACSNAATPTAAPPTLPPVIAPATLAPSAVPPTATRPAPTSAPTAVPPTATSPAPTSAPTAPAATPTTVATTASATTQMLNGKPCVAPAALTPAQTEGPLYVANPPQRRNFQADVANRGGKPLILLGQVFGQDCKPIANARVDLWHTDAKGEYDLSKTYTSRGYFNTDANGSYRFETIFPEIYPGRTAHFHLKVTPPNGTTLTTQVYFPDVTANNRDGIFDAKLLARMSKSGGTDVANFDFVVVRR